MFRRYGFTLAEALIAMVLIGIAVAIMSPALKKVVPDSNAILASKAYNILENGVKNIVDDSSYSNNSQDQGQDIDHMATVGKTVDTNAYVQKGLANLSITGTSVPTGQNKFCYLLSKQMNSVNSDCTSSNTFKTSNGMDWKVVTPSDAFSLRADNGGYTTRVIFDVNGNSNGPNCGDGNYITACANGKTPDKYEVGVRYDGRIKDSTDIVAATPTINDTCGADTVTPWALESDFYYHRYDAIVDHPVECPGKYLCIPCHQTYPTETCGPVVISNDGTNYYEKDPGPSGQVCSQCKLCGTGAGYCGESNTSCASNQPECTPVDNKVPSHTCPNVCNSAYVCGTSSSGTYTSFESFYYVKRDNNSSSCVHGNECSRTLCTPCSQGDSTKTCGPVVISNDATNYYEKDPGPSGQVCNQCKLCGTGAGYCGESNTSCASNQPECTPVDNKVPGHTCPNVCNPAYVLGSSSSGTYTTLEGSYYVKRDNNPSSCAYGKEVSRTLCSPCTQGNPNTTCGPVKISNDGTYYYQKDPGPTNQACYQCTMCSDSGGGCGMNGKTCASTSPLCTPKDARVSSKTCAPVCNANYVCGTSSSGTNTTFSNFYYYTWDNNSDAKTCFGYGTTPCSTVHCAECSNCGTHNDSCPSTSQYCNVVDDYNPSHVCSTYLNPTYQANPCVNYSSDSNIISYLQSMSNSSASGFTNYGGGREWYNFTYSNSSSVCSNLPSGLNIGSTCSWPNYPFYDQDTGYNYSNTDAAFADLAGRIATDIATALYAQSSSLTPAQINAAMNDAKTKTIAQWSPHSTSLNHTQTSVCMSESLTTNVCWSSGNRSYTANFKEIANRLLSSFHTYCSGHYDPTYVQCSQTTALGCGGVCDQTCQYYDYYDNTIPCGDPVDNPAYNECQCRPDGYC